jgi:branched-chain amino acid transport system substrate-binding protein
MGHLKRWKGALAIGLVLSVGVAACGGRDDGTADNNEQRPTGTGTDNGNGEAAFSINVDDCDGYNPTQGVTEDSIKFGSSFPQSGLFSAFAKISIGYEAYFRYINETEGGVDGRQIEIVTRNDEYLPDRTVTNAQELVQSDGVFGLFNVIGTPNNLAIRDDLTAECVPNLFVGTGSQLWGETEEYPWLIGSIPSYATEAAIFADYLEANEPNAQIAILAQNDDFGEGYISAFSAAIEDSDVSVVATERYNPEDPDVRGQITTLSRSGADTVLLAATALKCPQALNAVQESGWDPTIYLSATCTSSTVIGLAEEGAADDVFSSIYLKDPADPQWDDDEDMQQFQELGRQYGISAEDIENGIVGYGWTMGALLVETLRRSPELTRADVMETAYTLEGVRVGLLLPGITINTNGADDPFPIEQMQIGRYNGTQKFWELQGELVSFEGRTLDFIG